MKIFCPIRSLLVSVLAVGMGHTFGPSLMPRYFVKRRVLISMLFVLLLSLTGESWAQFAQRGGLAGTVFDSTGAVVPGAQITLLDLAQRQERKINADTAGHFEFDNLTAGQYQLTATLTGFQTAKSEPITVNIGGSAHFDFKLFPGSTTESVTVTAQEGGVDTERASIGTDVSTQQLEELPLNGRNFTSIAALTPGVSTYPQANVNTQGTYAVGAMFAVGGTQFTVGGAFEGSRDGGFYVNGVNINDNYESSISFEPSAEALGTGTIQVADFSAAVGHDISALTMQTKGGSSKFHGEAYDFIENDALNAVNPWTNANAIITGAPSAKPTLRRNQFGGNLSGPIFIPKLLPELKQRLFFFANYEKFIEHDGNALVTASVPSAAERTGDFSELLAPNQNPLQLYNPFYTTYDPVTGLSSRPAIAGNRLDLATRPNGAPLLDPGALAIQNALWPLPNVPNTPSNEVNYVSTQGSGISSYHFDTRFDAKITANDSIFVTWSKSSGGNTITGGIPPYQVHDFTNQDQAYLITANYVHIFTPHLTNEFIFGVGDGSLITISSSEQSFLNSASNPLNTQFQNTGTGVTKGIFAIDVGNYATPGTGEVFHDENKSYQISDNVDFVKGRHTLSAGMNYFRKSEIDWDVQRNVQFGGFSSGGGAQSYAGGDPMADLAMGLPSSMDVRYTVQGGSPTAPDYNIIFPYWGFYANDKFRINPKLTISAGLRYDLSIPDYTPNPSTAPCCAIYTSTPEGGVLEYPGIAAGLSNRYLKAPKLDFAPRLSIAYSPTPSTVIRAGYGIFYDTGASQVSNNLGNAIYGTSASVNYNVNNVTLGALPDTPVLNLSNIFPAPLTTTLGTFPVSTAVGQGYEGDGQWSQVTYYDQKSTPLPYYQRMLFDVQQQVGGHNVFTVSYVGAQGRKGQNEVNTNLPAYQTGWTYGGGVQDSTFNAARPNNSGRFGDIFVIRPTINSFYNAAIFQFQRSFSRGVQITSSYTWGKTVSDYPVVNNLATNAYPFYGGGGLEYPNLNSRGESTQSHRNRMVISGIWAPEYGKNWSAFARVPLTGWRISGIATFESGDALTVSNGGPNQSCPAADSGTPMCPTGFGSSAQDGASFDGQYGAAFDQLNISGNPNIGHGQKSLSKQFNTSVFSVPPMNVRGNSGFGTVRGPGQERLDLSLAKTFPLYKTLHLEFRADAFNALNHSQWNSVVTTYPSGSAQYPFGSVNGAGDARIGQVAAKLIF
ncbi:carboxypeptidase regulatory-like domain-containing protein [Granulicella sp. S156]|uniref:carboxypeptidase regulatory-like domain-containing protein n=1 Tax=Granulicella sp. S156 TaxID=1747224 RepID=UPI00131CBCEE|nr:carboxypeptidase regulatory-like domain-containing protein [Granulicella sp. S156]